MENVLPFCAGAVGDILAEVVEGLSKPNVDSFYQPLGVTDVVVALEPGIPNLLAVDEHGVQDVLDCWTILWVPA